MCGIAGTFRDDTDVDLMLDRIAHRGPDGRGTHTSGDTTLGHVRLAIQDPDPRANQPMTVGKTTVVYNGEAWNPDRLRLEARRKRWRTTSDTEPIAALLDERGPEALDLIDGMFAIAWTGPRGTWLARDRRGKIPLYARRHRDTWQFASEIKGLPPGGPALPIPPGSAVHLETGAITEWAKPVEPGPLDPDGLLAQIRAGVERRLISDRPVCFLLSGGLDSSLILALARELHPDPVAYTAVLDPNSADLTSARRIADELEIPLIEVPVPPVTEDRLRQAVLAVETPWKAQVEIALAHLPLTEAIANDGFRVALSGEGADELFLGYGNAAARSWSIRHDTALYQAVVSEQVGRMARGNFGRVNKVMMAYGVEARLPFLEEPIVEACLHSNVYTNPPKKIALKNAAAGVLPDWLIRRVKATFQGEVGTAAAAASIVTDPARYYRSLAVAEFGWKPAA